MIGRTGRDATRQIIATWEKNRISTHRPISSTSSFFLSVAIVGIAIPPGIRAKVNSCGVYEEVSRFAFLAFYFEWAHLWRFKMGLNLTMARSSKR